MSEMDRIKERIAQLQARQQALAARERERERKDQTRRQILLGAFVLHECKGQLTPEWLAGLDRFLSRPHERALFGLPPRE